MNTFIGRVREQAEFRELLAKKNSSLVSTSVIQGVDRKIAALKLPKNQSIRTVLVYDGQLAPSIEEDHAFDFLIPASKLFVN
ncbi:MAG: hypothetical protein ACK56W_02865 [Pirellula sp.]|jgi:hypothetical protein|nr:hypothetical protein [Pirellula sp.]